MSSEKQLELAGIPAVGFGSRSVQMLSSSFLTTAGLLAVRLLSCCLDVAGNSNSLLWLPVRHLAALSVTSDTKTLVFLQGLG